MIYRNSREYSQMLPREYELLKSWLAGEAGIENLKEWLQSIHKG